MILNIIQKNPSRYLFFGLSAVVLLLLMVTLVFSFKKEDYQINNQTITIPTAIIIPTSIPVSQPAATSYSIDNSQSLEDCLTQANKIINDWRSQCRGDGCEGADLVNDPRDQCYKKYGNLTPSPYWVITSYPCPEGYIKTCRTDNICECR